MTTERSAAARRVLVVDDDPDARLFLRCALEPSGWQVVEAASGEEALDGFDLIDPSVVVLDQRMPGLTGLDVAVELRSRGFDGAVVLFSAHLDRSLANRLRLLGVMPVSKVDHEAVLRVLSVYGRELVAAS